MQILNNVNGPAQRNFTDCLQQLRNNQDAGSTTIPDINQWLHYWNDDESFAGNLRNFRHWLERVKQSG
ncbi:MAG: hypothetical protein ABUL58_03930 [Steroidobacter sp.]